MAAFTDAWWVVRFEVSSFFACTHAPDVDAYRQLHDPQKHIDNLKTLSGKLQKSLDDAVKLSKAQAKAMDVVKGALEDVKKDQGEQKKVRDELAAKLAIAVEKNNNAKIELDKIPKHIELCKAKERERSEMSDKALKSLTEMVKELQDAASDARKILKGNVAVGDDKEKAVLYKGHAEDFISMLEDIIKQKMNQIDVIAQSPRVVVA